MLNKDRDDEDTEEGVVDCDQASVSRGSPVEDNWRDYSILNRELKEVMAIEL